MWWAEFGLWAVLCQPVVENFTFRDPGGLCVDVLGHFLDHPVANVHRDLLKVTQLVNKAGIPGQIFTAQGNATSYSSTILTIPDGGHTKRKMSSLK